MMKLLIRDSLTPLVFAFLVLLGGTSQATTESYVAKISKAAMQGDAWSQGELGLRYATGNRVPQDFQQAVIWSQKAAEQGDPTAQNTLGYLYEYGQGVPQDYNQAVIWYKKAAEQGFAIAQFNLSLKYAHGDGVPQDAKEALIWFKKAAEQGLAAAQFNLGHMYGKGEGERQNDVNAYAWFSLAASQGEAGAATDRDMIAKELTPEQRSAAEDLAAGLQAKIDKQAKRFSSSQSVIADQTDLRFWLQSIKPAAGGK